MRNIVKNVSLFQLVTFAIAVISLIINIVLLVALNQGRLLAADQLHQAGQQTSALAGDTLSYTFEVDQVIPIKADIPFNETVPVAVDFEVDEVFPVDLVVPFKDTFTVPIKAEIPVDTTVEIPISLPFSDPKALAIPINTTIPIDLIVDIPLETEVAINTEIPVKVPIKTEVMVNISRTLTVDTEVPLKMDVPIAIELSQTPFGAYLSDIGGALKDLASRLGYSAP